MTRSEEEFQEEIVSEVEKFLEKEWYAEKGVEVNKNVKILKDCTLVPEDNGKFGLYLGHAETDVAIYKDSQELSKEVKSKDFFKVYNKRDKEEFHVPLVIIETKSGEVTTDSIRSRTIIAREMNEIFPFIGYFFAAENTKKTNLTLYRQGKHFESFFIKKDRANEKWIVDNIIREGISPHLKKLKNLDII